MSEVSIKSLRDLRSREDQLRGTIVSDLRAFIHNKDEITFRRKPSSRSLYGDVNVTTTCSCVMALALTNEFRELYFPGVSNNEPAKVQAKAQDIFKTIVKAPWMSSGLTSNNAFTTALVLRTYGFLVNYHLLPSPFTLKKRWDLELSLTDPKDLVRLLAEQQSELTLFLYRCLTDDTRHLIEDLAVGKPVADAELKAHLTSDLQRIVHTTSIYHPDRFPDASPEIVAALYTPSLTAYELAERNHQLLYEAFPGEIQEPKEHSLEEIARLIAQNPENFSINNYPPAASIVYWFLDGVLRGDIHLEGEQWRVLITFGYREFRLQRSLLLAEDYARMDPVAMGMAACLCARMRKVSETTNLFSLGIKQEDLALLPSRPELQHAIIEVFGQLGPSGTWPKYFPMFHYQEAGSNFCFTFELLEAILHEFGEEPYELLSNSEVVGALERSVTWCEKANRLSCRRDEIDYTGWNSGGDLKTLTKDEPESWATAVVHMFLWELSGVLSHTLQQRILRQYRLDFAGGRANNQHLNELLDIEITMPGASPQGLVDLLKSELISRHEGKTEEDIRRHGITKPISALLFGPPGTSKTDLVKAIAEALGWPEIVINPSDFVRESLEKVYVRADDIFRDLGDLAAVVVFFDEMDALMQSRELPELDTATQFLTTSMLPKLTELHEHGRVIFLMATNYQSRFDKALKRAGRFDFLFCMGPPTVDEKVEKLDRFFPRGQLEAVQKTKAQGALRRYCKTDRWCFEQLQLFTFGEFKDFLRLFGDAKDIGNALDNISAEKFIEKVYDYSQYVTLRIAIGKESALENFRRDDPGVELEREPDSPLARYLRDRLESRRQ